MCFNAKQKHFGESALLWYKVFSTFSKRKQVPTRYVYDHKQHSYWAFKKATTCTIYAMLTEQILD